MFLVYSKRDNYRWVFRGSAFTEDQATKLNNESAEWDREQWRINHAYSPQPVRYSYQVRRM